MHCGGNKCNLKLGVDFLAKNTVLLFLSYKKAVTGLSISALIVDMYFIKSK